jgi:hypothetical protein
VFSPQFDNLASSDYEWSNKEYKNVALVLGEDEGTDRRSLVVGQSSSSGFDRRELYVDARDIQSEVYDDDGEQSTLPDDEYNALLQQRGEEKLAEVPLTNKISGEADTAAMFQYGVDFNMGDIVQVENEYGITSCSRVTEFVESMSSGEGVRRYPTFEAIND